MSRLYDIFSESEGVTTDSRSIRPGSIFFALRGETFDGNRFAVDALKKGAAYAVVDDPKVIEEAEQEFCKRLILCDNSLKTLQELACEHRLELGIPVIAVAGSNGKTTTKELITRVLAEKFNVYATHGNLNNHIGVPLTLLSMTRETEFGIVEMGASSCGEIALLTSIARPNYGILTNVGRAHLEGFGGVEGVRRGKGELYDFLAESGGRAFVPDDDSTLIDMAAERPNLSVEYYSVAAADGVPNHLEGKYNLRNIAAAMAIGRYFDVDEERIRHAIESYRPDNNRSQRLVTGRNSLIVDCYNANPSSMQASLDNFIAEGSELPKMAILGDMLELGRWAVDEHLAVIYRAVKGNIPTIWLVGRYFAEAAAGYQTDSTADIRLFASRDEAAAELMAHPVSGSFILIKGSHGVGLEKLLGLL